MRGFGYLKTLREGVQQVSRGVYHQVRHEWLGQHLPPKPTVMQFPINDICNAKCVMCNIGLRKRDREINSEELRKILKDPLFSDIQYVGISGGEPTLRADLGEMGEVLVESLPKLQGAGIITNAVREEMVTSRIIALSNTMKKKDLYFGVNVSLDGIGEIHDKNRGVAGNFDSAVQVIRELKAAGMMVSIGCTLTPINCYDADDVLIWCEENDINSFEFRIAVDIKRVYNEGYSQKWPLTSEQRFHLIMFFDKLSTHPQVDSDHREFYKSLVSQLAFNAPRSAGCDWKTQGVTLDSRGNISYCSVQSPILGSALEKSATHIFQTGLLERRKIIQEHCGSCQHDLLGPLPPSQLVKKGFSTVVNPWRTKIQNISARLSAPKFPAPPQIHPASKPLPEEWKHVLITGWYGTETAGDKAILGELVNFLRKKSPQCRITLTTLDSKVSMQTQKEMPELEGIRLVEIEKGSDPALVESVDAVFMGGGPLEEIEETDNIYRIFVEANRQHKSRILFGCGVGPIYTEKLKEMVGSICKMATGGFLRDEQSMALAFDLSGITFPIACDPALAYFRRWYLENNGKTSKGDPKRIVTLLRANTNEYLPDVHYESLEKLNLARAAQLAEVLENIPESENFAISLLAMHSLPVGGDDRLFNRFVMRNFKARVPVHLEKKYLTLPQLLSSILTADIAFTMRYHGHLLCMAFGIPFLSLDYTGEKGKVQNLIHRMGLEQYAENWSDFDLTRVTSRVKKIFSERQELSAFLMKETDRLLDELQKVYSTSFPSPAKR